MASTLRDVGVVLVAGGGGKRFGGQKQFLQLAGKPVLHYSLDAFAALEDVAEVIVVLPAESVAQGRELVAEWRESFLPTPPRSLRLETVLGGRRRQDSALHGLEALSDAVEQAMVHDVARPLIRTEDVRKIVASVRAHGAAVIGTPLSDSLKRERDGMIVEELPRQEIWAVQTPQAARLSLLRDAYRNAGGRDWTDEASALRHLGIAVALVEGPRENFKITRPGDEELVEMVLKKRLQGGP